MNKPFIARFAPSPTGYLHIGGARTALFNWLLARKNNGKMLLRIEDTDRSRSTDDAINAILSGLEWLGLSWDDDVISQFENVNRHQEIAEKLLESGKAYRCFTTPEELQEIREKAKDEHRPPIYDGRWRDRDPAEAPPGAKSVIRIKTPLLGETIVDDQVQGKVTFPNKDLDDFIILRSDGTPTYMLAVVVDDHDMGVSHIIRGDDHLTNAARQSIIFEALNWDVPVMAHIPLIHGPDGKKLSKRHGALAVDAYRELGYLPEAMRNYLARLGWGHGDDEIFDTNQLIKWFDLSGIGKSAARFDFKKLNNLNGHYIRATPDEKLVQEVINLHLLIGRNANKISQFTELQIHQLTIAMPSLKERAKTLIELLDSAEFIWALRPLKIDEEASQKLDSDAQVMLKNILVELKLVSDWNIETLEDIVNSFAETNELKLGKVAPPLRSALTGKVKSPGIFDVLAVLGKEESIARIQDQVK